MSVLYDSSPSDIPGLVQQWSPALLLDGTRCVVSEIGVDVAVVLWTDASKRPCRKLWKLDDLALDLTHKHGRADAAWWCRWKLATEPFTAEDLALIGDAEQGVVMSAAQIDALARLVLRLAGRSA